MNILGIVYEKTKGKENSEVVGKPFVTKAIAPEIAEEINRQQEEIDKLRNGADLPLWFRISQMLSMLACIVLLFVYSMLRDESWSVAFIIGAAVILLAFAVSSVLAKRWERKKKQSLEGDAEAVIKKVNATYRKAKKSMGIPESAREVDVFMQKYTKAEDGALKDKSLIIADYASLSEFIYLRGDSFVIAGIDMELSIPLKAVKKIRCVDKPASFIGWNKRNPHTAPEFARYKIKMSKYEVYSVKPYYELVIENESLSGVIKFPPYELDSFTRLLHLKVEQAPVSPEKAKEKGKNHNKSEKTDIKTDVND